jgi:putative hemolysin
MADHIVDVLIAERAPKLSASPAWPALRPALYGLLGYAKARRMADAMAPLGGREAMDFASDMLRVQVRSYGLDRIPTSGRLVLVCDHPTGIADGVAVYDALKGVRPDLIFFANADALRVSPRLIETVVPVEWVETKRTRERTRLTLTLAREAFEAERAVMIFPAGMLARRVNGVLIDPPWAPSALSLARKYEATVVPMHLSGPHSTLFHLFDRFSKELRDITLFHELLNKRHGRFALTVGPPIPPGALDADAGAMTEALKHYCERVLPAHPDRPFS